VPRGQVGHVLVPWRLRCQIGQRVAIGPELHAGMDRVHEAQVVRPRAVVQMQLRFGRKIELSAHGRVVTQSRIDHRQIDHVEPETVDPAREPEVRHLEQCVLHLGVVDVQVWHLGIEVRQIVLAPVDVPLPGGTAEYRLPVVGRCAVGLGVGPHVPVVPCVVARGAAFLEPGVPIRAVGVDLIDQHFQAQRVRTREQGIEVGQRTQTRIDCAIVLAVVAEVVHRRLEERTQPDAVHAKARHVLKPLRHARQVAPTIAVTVCEAQRIDLVQRRAVPPGPARRLVWACVGSGLVHAMDSQRGRHAARSV